MTATAWSRGWGARVELGSDQSRILEELRRSVRNPSRSWHRAPVMRELGRWSSVTHRTLHRLASLGVIALQTTRGARGGTRFSFGVRFWRTFPPRVGQLARMFRGGGSSHPSPRDRAPAAGQLSFREDIAPPGQDPGEWQPTPRPEPYRPPEPLPPVPPRDDEQLSAFDRAMLRHGFDRRARPASSSGRLPFGRGR